MFVVSVRSLNHRSLPEVRVIFLTALDQIRGDLATKVLSGTVDRSALVDVECSDLLLGHHGIMADFLNLFTRYPRSSFHNRD